MKWGKKPKGVKLIIKSENEQKYDIGVYLLRKQALKELQKYGEPRARTIGQLDDLGWHTAYTSKELKIWRKKIK
jgi:hypothetical protein|tara:strand:+ start:283 stop:504 length:222 start_codon:yes stop_codon:yes gene_type:complete